ncbi:MAG: ketoacyl-synthetase C-terminal extension domain-containing protein, partial [Pseudomonadota bacterium]
IVVLKRLTDARADGNRIFALVRGSAVNHDGRSNGISAPNLAAQEALVRAAICDAAVSPADIVYVEAHGTGTALGDPIEVRALAAALGEGRTAPLLVGAVKSNIGHLEAAAGAAGFIKLALALGHGEVPPNLHFDTPNPHIPWERLPVRVVDAQMPLSAANDGPIIAGTSAFGMSGTNVHMVLEAPPPMPEALPAAGPHIVPLSARTKEALHTLVSRTFAQLSLPDAPPIADIALTAGRGRAHHAVRTAAVVATVDDLIAALAGATVADKAPRPPAIVFAFAANIADRAAHLAFLTTEPASRDILQAADDALQSCLGQPLGDLVANPQQATVVDACLAHAWAALLERCGIAPTAVLGVGPGEYGAALVTGAMDVAALVALTGAASAAGEGSDVAHLRPAFAQAGRAGQLKPPGRTTISGMLGKVVGREFASPYSWADHAVRPTDVAAASAALVDTGSALVEFGDTGLVVPGTITRLGPAHLTSRSDFLTLIAALYNAGAPINWRAVVREGRTTTLPTYPFARIPCRIERDPPRQAPPVPVREHLVDVAGSPNHHVATHLSEAEVAFLAEHRVFRAPAMPAAAIADIVAAAGSKALGPS